MTRLILIAVLLASFAGCEPPSSTSQVERRAEDSNESDISKEPDISNATDRSSVNPPVNGKSTLDRLIESSASVEIPDGPVAPETVRLLDQLCDPDVYGDNLENTLEQLAETGDARAAWVVLDRLRLEHGYETSKPLVKAFSKLMNVNIADDRKSWRLASNLMIARDIPAPPGYADWKSATLETVDKRFNTFFEDDDANVDWRVVSWGGVLIDDRAVDKMELPGFRCIPALTDPKVTDAAGGDWYTDDKIIFGVEIDGESRAYPKNVMEIHEMVNDELGGRRFALPYCTLCGAAQLYFTDNISESAGNNKNLPGIPLGRYELRTSGLLQRSNKFMFELQTYSLFDTFTGEAVSGPLRIADVSLPRGSVATMTWGEWKRVHPDTTILASESPWGRKYPDDPLKGRDDNGPIFPIGKADSRLPIQEPILGIIKPDGTAIAFPVAEANRQLEETESGDAIEFSDVKVQSSENGLFVTDASGTEIPSHQAFWFAWSQFHPETKLWRADSE